MDGASSGRIEIGFEGVFWFTLAALRLKEDNTKELCLLLSKTKEDDIKPIQLELHTTYSKQKFKYELGLPNKRIY